MTATTKNISAADANRRFSELLRGVREGKSFIVTSHGKPIARLIPVGTRDRTAATARTALIERLRREKVTDVGPWAREDLY